MVESSNRVDLGNVKGKRGSTGVGISNIVKMPSSDNPNEVVVRVYYDDNTNVSPHYTDLTINISHLVNRINQLSNYIPTEDPDREDVPSIYLLKTELAKRPMNTDVYRKEVVYTKDEVYNKNESYAKTEVYNKNEVDSLFSNVDLFIIVEDVTELTSSQIKQNRIYIQYKTTDTSDGLNSTFDLYIYNDGDWRQLDSLTFNINEYYTKTESNSLFSRVNHTHTTANISNSSQLSIFNSTPSNQDVINKGFNNAISSLQNVNITIDNQMNANSTNAVQNKVIKAYIDSKISSATGSIESGDSVSFTPVLTSGTKIGTITINGADVDIFCTDTSNLTYANATQSSNGLMSSTDKTKMDKSMVVGYGNSSGSTSAFTVSINGVTLTHGTIIAVYNNTANNAANATLKVGSLSAKPIYYKDSPTPSNKFLHKTTALFMYNTSVVSGGCWQMLDFDTTYNTATTSENGLMSSADKTKLDGITTGANNYTHPTYTARTGKPTANQTPAFGGTATVSQITSDATGHITGATDRTIKIPNTVASTSANGLMSSTDKTKLNAIEEEANKYIHPSYTARTGVPTGNQTPAFGGTFTVSQPVSDATGHITNINSRTITIPSTTASTSTKGIVQLDNTPKNNSTNAVTSGGIYNSLSAKADKSQVVDVNNIVFVSKEDDSSGSIILTFLN